MYCIFIIELQNDILLGEKISLIKSQVWKSEPLIFGDPIFNSGISKNMKNKTQQAKLLGSYIQLKIRGPK